MSAKKGQYQSLQRIGLRRLAGEPGAAHRLFCFPFMGGQSLSFRPFARALGESWEVLAIDPPGHGWQRGLPVKDLEELLAIYEADLGPWLDERPYHFLGHSMGGLVAHVLASRRGKERGPRNLFVSGSPLPHRVQEYAYLRPLSNDELYGKLDVAGSMGGSEANAWFLDLVMPVIRADLEVLLAIAPPLVPRAEAPLWIMYSQEDTFVPPGNMHEWRRYGTEVRFEVTLGDHLFVITRPDAVARWIESVVQGGRAHAV